MNSSDGDIIGDHFIPDELPISSDVWHRLVQANKQAAREGWAAEGVFATGVGPDYQRGGGGSLLFVGKSAGPLAYAMGSSADQATSGIASAQWMAERRNHSAFWQFADKLDQTRRHIAWTNVCKMDRKGGQRPPTYREWSQVADACIAALADEIMSLSPQVILFTTSGVYQSEVTALLRQLSYAAIPVGFDDRWTSCFQSPAGKYAITTKHPQGWDRASRECIVDLTVRLMSGTTTQFYHRTDMSAGQLGLMAGRENF